MSIFSRKTVITRPGLSYVDMELQTDLAQVFYYYLDFSDKEGLKRIKRVFDFDEGVNIQIVQGVPPPVPYNPLMDHGLVWGVANIVDGSGLVVLELTQNATPTGFTDWAYEEFYIGVYATAGAAGIRLDFAIVADDLNGD